MDVYLDNSATTRTFPEVAELMTKIMCEDYGNPSSLHMKGVEAEKYLRYAKETLARILKVEERELLFTSGGTESDNMALIGCALANCRRGNHLITTKLWAMFRNNPYLIIDCLEKAKNQFSSTRKLEKIRNSFRINPNRVDTCSAFIHYSFLTALGVVVFSIVLNLIFAYMLNCLVFLYLGAAYGIIWMLTTSFCNSYSDEEEKKVIETYYEAYYYVQQKSKNSDISVMEGQVAFMQSMSIPLALLAVSSCSLTAASANCTFRLIMFSLFIIIFPMVICRIRKIHSRVWEDYEFLSGMEDNDQTKK